MVFGISMISNLVFSALLLHLGFSLMVWAAVRKGGRWLWLFPVAIALHAVVEETIAASR